MHPYLAKMKPAGGETSADFGRRLREKYASLAVGNVTVRWADLDEGGRAEWIAMAEAHPNWRVTE